MSDAIAKVTKFLRANGMSHEDIDMDSCCQAFLDEMEKGLAGDESSLKMLPTYIETGDSVAKNKPVIVLDAGGTKFRCAVVHFDGKGNAVIENFKEQSMPGAESEVTSEQFFDTLANYTQDVIDKSDTIGFCFSYPCEMQPGKDGKLIYFSKEMKAQEVLGRMIGENLNTAINRLGLGSDKKIIILNDTVTTLLAGKANDIKDGAVDYDSYIGFILGTGTNSCYVEQNSNIKKASGLDASKSQVINIESAGFTNVPSGQIDKLFDASTNDPGIHVFEKMTSGAYLGPLCLKVIETAVLNGLFSELAKEKLSRIVSLDTIGISKYLEEPSARVHVLGEILHDLSNFDRAIMLALIESIVTRAAKLIAIKLSAVAIKSGKGKSADKPVCIVAEGTTFYKLPGLKEKTEEFLNRFLTYEKEIHYEMASIKNATLIGAAIAGLTN